MRKIIPLLLALVAVSIFPISFTSRATALTEPDQTVSEQVPADEEEENDGNGKKGSMVPIEPGEENPQSQPKHDSFGLSLSSVASSNENAGGSPWGGILFFAAAIALGIGLAVARNKK